MDTENENIEIQNLCDSIMNSIVEYLSDEVYVEKKDNLFYIKSFSDSNTLSGKEINISLNRSEFNFNFNSPSQKNITVAIFGTSNKSKNIEYDTGSFQTKISKYIFNKYEKWLLKKHEDFFLQKIKSLKSNFEKEFKIDKTIKRKRITDNIIKEKE